MSANSMKNQKAAEKNEELLGTTNVGTREHQSPATASKVERAQVQANVQEVPEIVGNTANRKERAIPSEFRADTDATRDRIEAVGGEVPESANPQNRFAPNNVGADAASEGQSVKLDGEFPVGISTEEAKVQGLDVADTPEEAAKVYNDAERAEFGDGTLSEEPGLPRVDGQEDSDDGELDTRVPAEKKAKVKSPASAFGAAESNTPEVDEAKSRKNKVNPKDVVVGQTGAAGDGFGEENNGTDKQDKETANKAATAKKEN